MSIACIKRYSEERLLKVLLAPVVSEKATLVGDKNNQVIFLVALDATKPEIKAAVEMLFKVNVEAVNVVNRVGKPKRSGRFKGRRNQVRRAFVSLRHGQEVSFFEGVK